MAADQFDGHLKGFRFDRISNVPANTCDCIVWVAMQWDYWNYIKLYIFTGWTFSLVYAVFFELFSFHIIPNVVRQYFYIFFYSLTSIIRARSSVHTLSASSIAVPFVRFLKKIAIVLTPSDFHWLIALHSTHEYETFFSSYTLTHKHIVYTTRLTLSCLLCVVTVCFLFGSIVAVVLFFNYGCF